MQRRVPSSGATTVRVLRARQDSRSIQLVRHGNIVQCSVRKMGKFLYSTFGDRHLPWKTLTVIVRPHAKGERDLPEVGYASRAAACSLWPCQNRQINTHHADSRETDQQVPDCKRHLPRVFHEFAIASAVPRGSVRELCVACGQSVWIPRTDGDFHASLCFRDAIWWKLVCPFRATARERCWSVGVAHGSGWRSPSG